MNNLFRKSLVCGIILLFIVSVTSSIGRNANEVPINPLNSGDYVNVYWKFNEGSSSIAHDSSGHDYDGTIYGATWVGGYTGYALDFDGVDDYVSVDVHSEGIGFNKTDDLIFSLWFKSTSTDDGLIYCLSDAGGTTNPEVFIGLNSDGNITVQTWVQSCGLSITSEGSYNDGEWHSVEIFYHGTTSQPTVEIYVDDEFDSSIQEWVCSFSADEFKKAKIGRRAYDATKHFDGAIDELKVIKYPQGNKQPSQPVIDGPTFGMPNELLCYTFVSNDTEGDEIEYYIDWDDGIEEGWFGPYDPGVEITKCHDYDEEGTYYITAKARDFWHDGWWALPGFRVNIGNHAPEQPDRPSGPINGSINIEYTYSTMSTDEDGDEIFYNWSWDDGTFSGWLGPYDSSDTCYASHAWDSPSTPYTYDIKVMAKDNISESLWSDPLFVNIVISSIEIGEITGGFLYINAVIKNTGAWEATDVNWSISLVGGLIFSGRNSSGEIPSIPAGGETTVRSAPIIGLGKTLVVVTANAQDGSHAYLEKNAFVFLFIIIL